MTDIYDRLKNAHSENAVGACEAALHELWARDKEIERLRQANRELATVADARGVEIERLYKEVANRAHSEEQYRREIERLREQAERDLKAINGTYIVQRDLKAEIELLRQMVKDAAQALNDEERDNERLREMNTELWEALAARGTEIERLREHLTINAEGEADDARMI